MGGIKIFLTHGHLYGVWDNGYRIAMQAKEKGCKVALFGHSHIKVCEDYDGVTAFNPGSISRPREGNYSVGIMEIENGRVSFVHCDWL